MLASTPLVCHSILMTHVAERECAPVAKIMRPNVLAVCAAQYMKYMEIPRGRGSLLSASLPEQFFLKFGQFFVQEKCILRPRA